MNTSFASLPVPDAHELERMPSEFAGLLQTVRSITHAKSGTEMRCRGAYFRPWQEPVQVLHIDDPRASVYALFA
jgi:hypothetical protein